MKMVRSQTYTLQSFDSKDPFSTLSSEKLYLSDSSNLQDKGQSSMTFTDDMLARNTQDKGGETATKGKKLGASSILLGLVLLLFVYSEIVTSLVTTQYVYAYIHQDKFPNVSFSSIDNESECLVDKSSQTYLDQQVVQKLASEFNIYKDVAKGIPNIVVTLIGGSLSDRYGRKYILFLPFTAKVLMNILTALGIYLKWNIYVFVSFAFIDGCGGSWMLLLSVVMALVADLIKPGKSRTFAIAIVEVSLGMGQVIGGVTSGFIIKGLGFLYATVISLSCSIMSILLLIFLPETLKKPADKPKTSALELATSMFVFYFKDAARMGKRKKILLCLGIYLFNFLAFIGATEVQTLYLLNSPFCWDTVRIGWYRAIRSGVPLLFVALLIRPLQRCMDETAIILLASASAMAGYLLQAFAYTSIMLYLLPVVFFAASMVMPVIRGMTSRLTPPEKQGTMFAGIGVTETVCTLLGTVLASTVYANTVDVFRGTIFLVFAGNILISSMLTVILMITTKRQRTSR